MFASPQCTDCLFKSPATKELNTQQLGQLEQNCAVAKLKNGDVLFRQGIFSSNIVYLKKGIVKLFVEGPYHEQIIRIVKGPTYLGIPTTFDEKYNHFSAVALEDVDACFIDVNTFKSFVQENGQFSYEIIVELCRNELNLFNKCVSRAQKNARGRIADALLFLYNEIYQDLSFKMPLSRKELGNYVDTTRESASRILSEFTADKIIEINGKMIRIVDLKKMNLISKNG